LVCHSERNVIQVGRWLSQKLRNLAHHLFNPFVLDVESLSKLFISVAHPGQVPLKLVKDFILFGNSAVQGLLERGLVCFDQAGEVDHLLLHRLEFFLNFIENPGYLSLEFLELHV
jgi:hypothetical protein